MKKLGMMIAMLGMVSMAYWLLKPSPNYDSHQTHTGLVISHKTAGLEYPENTEEGFRASLEMDVAAIELDVHMVKDGRFVLHHDPVLLDYNCFAKGDATRLIVARQTVDSLAALNCMNHKVGAPYQIISFDRILEIYSQTNQSKKLLLEVKVWDEQIENKARHEGLDMDSLHYSHPDVARNLYKLLRRFPAVTNIQFNSFSRDLLLELKALKRPEEAFEFGLLYKGEFSPATMAIPGFLLGYECSDFCWIPDYEEVGNWLDDHDIHTFIPHFVQATSLPFYGGFQQHIMDDRGDLKVIPWTLNTPEDWSRYETAGFDGILTDVPTEFMAWAAD